VGKIKGFVFELRPCVLVYLRNRLIPSPNSHALLIAAFAALLGLLVFLSIERSVDWFNRWIYTHWLFNYEFGLIKRGFVGEVLVKLDIPRNYYSLYEVARWNLHIINALIVLMLLIPAMRHRLTLGWLLFCAVFITNPGTLQQMAFGVGRVNFVGTMLAVIFLLVAPHLRRGTSLALLVVIGCLSVAIHEASLLLRLPLLLAVFVWLHREKSDTLTWAAAAGALFVALVLYLNEQTARFPLEEQAYLEHLQGSFSHVHHVAVKVLFSSLSENVSTTLNQLMTVFSLLQHGIFLVVMFPVGLLVWKSSKAVWAKVCNDTPSQIAGPLLFLACLSPLALYLLGVDFFRWQSNVLFNVFLLLTVLSRDEQVYKAIAKVYQQGWGWALAAIGIGWASGPAGDYFSFYWARLWLS